MRLLVHRHGVPHRFTVDWRGLALWLLQCIVLVIIAGVVK